MDAWAYEANRCFRDLLVGAQSREQFDSMLQNAIIQFFNADVDMEKLYCISIITLNHEWVPSGDFRRIFDCFLRRVPNVMRLDNRSDTSMHFVVQRQLTDVPDCQVKTLLPEDK